MTVAFKSPVTSSNVNSSFISKNSDDVTIGVLGLANSRPESSTPVVNLQQFVKELADTTGYLGEGDATRKDYNSDYYIANGQNRKEAIEALDGAIFNLSQQLVDAKRFINFSSDAEYESNYTLEGGEVYYNTSTGLVRYYDISIPEWRNVGASSIGEQERLGFGNGVNTVFNLTFVPINPGAVKIFLNGVLSEESEYTINGSEITLLTAPVAGQVVYASYLTEGTPASGIVTGVAPKTEYITVTAADVTNGYFVLNQTPASAENVHIDKVNGATQVLNVDFSVNANEIVFTGLDPDGVFTDGALFRVFYFFA